jgi:predicted subunit of tRNA(5-methylaminomethyl-2-thiouridylate) methyltransferase
MAMEHWNRSDAAAASIGVQDAQDIAAGLLLRRVEAMLRQGQPRQAIAHICEMTGVDRAQADEFVAELKLQLFAGKV